MAVLFFVLCPVDLTLVEEGMSRGNLLQFFARLIQEVTLVSLRLWLKNNYFKDLVNGILNCAW